jgi:hypothetical protein
MLLLLKWILPFIMYCTGIEREEGRLFSDSRGAQRDDFAIAACRTIQAQLLSRAECKTSA